MPQQVYANTKAIGGLYLLDLEDLQLESIDDVSEISFNLSIIDENTWEAIDTSDVITLNFNQ